MDERNLNLLSQKKKRKRIDIPLDVYVSFLPFFFRYICSLKMEINKERHLERARQTRACAQSESESFRAGALLQRVALTFFVWILSPISNTPLY